MQSILTIQVSSGSFLELLDIRFNKTKVSLIVKICLHIFRCYLISKINSVMKRGHLTNTLRHSIKDGRYSNTTLPRLAPHSKSNTNAYLEHQRFCLGITRISNISSPIVLLNLMILNYIWVQVILLLSGGMSNTATVNHPNNLILSVLEPSLFY